MTEQRPDGDRSDAGFNTATPNLDSLRLSEADVDDLTGLDCSELAMGRATRLSLFRRSSLMMTWSLSLLLTLGVALVLCVPVTLVLAKGLTGSAETAVMLQYLPLGVGGAIAITVAWHGYALYQGRQLKTLDRLLLEVAHYNEMLTAVEVYYELATAQGKAEARTPEPVAIMLEALHLTRENLVNGLTTERILRKHQRFMAQRQALFSRMEQNLSALQAMQVVDAASEYGTLLSDALEIGVQVQREMQSLTPRS